MKRPCGVSQTAWPRRGQKLRVRVRRNVSAPRVLLLDAKKAEVLEEAVALEHRGVDRRERGAAGKELARKEQANAAGPTTRHD